VSAALAEQLDPRFVPQLLAEEVRAVGSDAELRTGENLRGVPVVREPRRLDLEVQLHRGARRLGSQRVRIPVELLPRRPLDVEVDVLPARGEHGVVQGLVSRVGTHPVALEVLGHDRREDPDHEDVRPHLVGLALGLVERGPQVLLQLQGGRPVEGAGCDVELDVVARQLGLVVGVLDGLEDLGVVESGFVVLVDEVELDLHPGHIPVGVEARVLQHPLEHVEVKPDFFAVLLALFSGEARGADLGAHAAQCMPVATCAAMPRPQWDRTYIRHELGW
jgi:hypothetical protein